MLCSLLRLSCRKMGARPGLDLILSRNGLIIRRNGLIIRRNGLIIHRNGLIIRRNGLIIRRNGVQVIIDDDFLEEGGCYGR